MDAFSSGLSMLFEKMEMVSQLFSEISKNYNSILIALFDAKGITLGEYYRPHLQLQEKLKIYEKYIELQKRVVTENRTLLEFSDKFGSGERFTGIIEVLNFGNLDFFLLFIVEEDKTDLEKTITILDKIEAALSGNRGPSSSKFGPARGLAPTSLMWSVKAIRSPGSKPSSTAPAETARASSGSPPSELPKKGPKSPRPPATDCSSKTATK